MTSFLIIYKDLWHVSIHILSEKRKEAECIYHSNFVLSTYTLRCTVAAKPFFFSFFLFVVNESCVSQITDSCLL